MAEIATYYAGICVGHVLLWQYILSCVNNNIYYYTLLYVIIYYHMRPDPMHWANHPRHGLEHT